MKKYYYIEDEIRKGPFLIKELSDKNIHKKTLVWTDNMENWEEANNIIELKEIINIIPPPIPSKAEKPIRVEAEISRKKEKILTPEREIIIAKETKRVFKISIYTLIFSFILLSVLFGYNKGFSNYSIRQKLQDDLERGTPDYTEIESRTAERQIIKDESERLGYYYDKESYGGFDTYEAINHHNRQIKYALEKSIKPTLVTSLLMFFILLTGKHIFNGAKWVESKSKIEI